MQYFMEHPIAVIISIIIAVTFVYCTFIRNDNTTKKGKGGGSSSGSSSNTTE